MDENDLYRLEESLWKTQTRFDQDYMDGIFDVDFREFGRSGRRYDRAEMFFSSAETREINAIFPLKDFTVQCLSDAVFLVTYISEITNGDCVQRSNRSSIWKQSEAGWKLMFHQGTPCP